jgi:hypothetical protein
VKAPLYEQHVRQVQFGREILGVHVTRDLHAGERIGEIVGTPFAAAAKFLARSPG